jgi:formyltetrahydrofolate synthetase
MTAPGVRPITEVASDLGIRPEHLVTYGPDKANAVIARACGSMNAPFAVSEHYGKGGDGAVELARAVVAHAERHSRRFHPLYAWPEPVKVKADRLAWANWR